MPVLLTRQGELPATVETAITDLGLTDVVVAGGTVAVSAGVMADVVTAGASAMRVAGANRSATAVEMAEYAMSMGWASAAYVGVATQASFADALGGGAATGANGGVLLLTNPWYLPEAPTDFLEDNRLDVLDVTIFGGPAAVTGAVMDEISAALE
jgi:hypothetical protein